MIYIYHREAPCAPSRAAPRRRAGLPCPGASLARGDRQPQPPDQVVDPLAVQLGRRPPHTPPGADLEDRLDLDEVVLAQRLARGDEVDDAIGETDQRRDLDGSVELDDLGDDAAGLQVPAGQLRELGRIAQVDL